MKLAILQVCILSSEVTVMAWKIILEVLYLENLQQMRSKDTGSIYMIVLKNTWTLSWRTPYHFRNQSVDLDWFLYDRDHTLLYIISYYDPQNKMHRRIRGFVCIPVLVREMYLFVTNWKRHPIRFQKELYPRSNYRKWQNYQESWGSKTNILKITLRTDAINW